MNFWIIVCQAAIIGFGNIVSLGNRQEVDKYLPSLWIDVADTVEKPIELLFASHEHTAKDDPKTSLRITLGVNERECCPPGTAEHQPHFNAQKRAQCFNIVHKVVGGVVGDVGIRRGPPSAALIKQDDPVVRRIKKPAMVRRRSGTGAAMEEDYRLAERIAGLFPIKGMAAADREHAMIEGFDPRIKVTVSRSVCVVSGHPCNRWSQGAVYDVAENLHHLIRRFGHSQGRAIHLLQWVREIRFM